MKPKILILTASFGDGHNSAARHLAEALETQANVKIADPCHLGNPVINRFLCRVYREITTYTPRVWSWIYQSTDRQDFSKPLPFIAKTEDAVAALLDEFNPDIVVNTYPLYPITGFPVSPRFENLSKISSTDEITPFRVLFFPTARSPHVNDIIHAVLSQKTEITVVLGRNIRRLYKKTRKLKEQYPGRIHLKGWTRQVPELLSSHHLVIGKAGGATVHEAIAAECPMLVHHIVPGQEEGNIELLQRFEVGSLATDARTITETLSNLLANDGKLWRKQQERLASYAKPSAAREAAQVILSKLPTS